MRRRYNVKYEITTFGYFDIWYDRKVKRWIDTSITKSKDNSISSHQSVKKFRKAQRIAWGIFDRWGKKYPNGEVVISRIFWKHGIRMIQEFYYSRETERTE